MCGDFLGVLERAAVGEAGGDAPSRGRSPLR